MINQKLLASALALVLTAGMLPASYVPSALAEGDNPYIFQNTTEHPNQQKIEMVRFTAQKGEAEVTSKTSDVLDEQEFAITNTNGVLLADGKLKGGESMRFDLPTDGDFYLSQQYFFKPATFDGARGLNLRAQGLVIKDASVPKLDVNGLEPFEVKNSTFELTLTPISNVVAASITVNGTLVKEEGTGMEPVTIDPLVFGEGVHDVVVEAVSASGNKVAMLRNFVVDRYNAFGDVPEDHWAHHQIEVMQDVGILDGRAEGVFLPGGSVTREEFAKMLALSLKLKIDLNPAVPFSDMKSGDWSVPYVAALKKAGLVEGKEQGGKILFHPTDNISRAEVATMLGRTNAFSGMPIAGGATFVDNAKIPSWAKTGVSKLSTAGWIDGYEDGSFYPLQGLSRAEAAKILSYFLGM